jgi:hypothetical protein
VTAKPATPAEVDEALAAAHEAYRTKATPTEEAPATFADFYKD